MSDDANTARTYCPVDPNWTRLYDFARQLGVDELAVLTKIAERLVAGRRVYGELALNSDGRNWASEAFEEVCDASVYCAIRLLLASKI